MAIGLGVLCPVRLTPPRNMVRRLRAERFFSRTREFRTCGSRPLNNTPLNLPLCHVLLDTRYRTQMQEAITHTGMNSPNTCVEDGVWSKYNKYGFPYEVACKLTQYGGQAEMKLFDLPCRSCPQLHRYSVRLPCTGSCVLLPMLRDAW